VTVRRGACGHTPHNTATGFIIVLVPGLLEAQGYSFSAIQPYMGIWAGPASSLGRCHASSSPLLKAIQLVSVAITSSAANAANLSRLHRCRRLPAPPGPRGIAARRTPRSLAGYYLRSAKSPYMHPRPLHPVLQSSPIDPALSPSISPGFQIHALFMAARRQAWQFAAALVFFHASEYVLAVAFHGRRNVTTTCK
jgi:hypothetical protein